AAARHSQDYSSLYSNVPGLNVVAPFSAADYKGLLKAAIRDPNPVIFLENEMLYGHTGEVPKLDDYVIPIGKARIVRSGSHVTIISWSNGMSYALKAADELAKDGIEAEVIDLRTLRPMDTETIINSVKKTGRAVTVEEGWAQSGVGAEIATRIMENVLERDDAVEILRVFVLDGGLSMAFQRAFEEPDMWGLLLVDLARHAARAYARESEYTEEDALSRILEMFQAEIERPTDNGTTTPRGKGH